MFIDSLSKRIHAAELDVQWRWKNFTDKLNAEGWFFVYKVILSNDGVFDSASFKYPFFKILLVTAIPLAIHAHFGSETKLQTKKKRLLNHSRFPSDDRGT